MAPQIDLPPGFRFYPTDEELVVHYLCRKAASQAFPVPVIAEIDLYKFDPWDLPEKALFGEKEWYFFSPRDRKYPNGSRPNRAAGSGYWKATGTDKPIHTAGPSSKVAGVKKALVFYTGKAPRGVKTNWIMHEYRLADAASRAAKRKGSLRLDDWVLCRIYKKVYSAQKAAMFKDSYESSSCLEEETSPPSEPTIHLPKIHSIGMNNLEEDDCHIEKQQQRCRVPRFEESYSHRYLQQEQENNEMASVSQGQQQMLLGMGFDPVTSTFHGSYNQNLVPHMERLPSLGNPTASAFFANLAAELL